MNEKKTTVSLELLLLNDLLRTNTIDKEIYDKAAQKIVAIKDTVPVNNQPIMMATA